MRSPEPTAVDDMEMLLAKQELLEIVTRYCRAIDRCDEDMLLSCFHADAFDDHGGFKGAPADFVAYLRGSHLDPSVGPIQHAISNCTFEVDGDMAWGETYVESRNVQADGSVARGLARYVDRYERRDGAWRIADRRVILEAARPGFDRSLYTQGTCDRSDPSYERRRGARDS